MAKKKARVAKKKATGATRKPPEKPVNTAPSLPGWAWMVCGVLIGLFIAFLVFLQSQDAEDNKASSQSAPQSQPKTNESSAENGDEKTRFEFYTILPEVEVLVPEDQLNKKQSGGEQVAPVEKKGKYILQSGSFRRFADADRRKANLALLGIESEIQTVKVNANETWHRVRVGPYTDLDELNNARSLLHENNIETLLVRIKG